MYFVNDRLLNEIFIRIDKIDGHGIALVALKIVIFKGYIFRYFKRHLLFDFGFAPKPRE